MKIYNVMKVPQGLGYDDVDYDAIYQSGYTAGYEAGYNEGMELCGSEVINYAYNEGSKSFTSKDLSWEMNRSIPTWEYATYGWVIPEPVIEELPNYLDSEITVSPSNGTGGEEITVTVPASPYNAIIYPVFNHYTGNANLVGQRSATTSVDYNVGQAAFHFPVELIQDLYQVDMYPSTGGTYRILFLDNPDLGYEIDFWTISTVINDNVREVASGTTLPAELELTVPAWWSGDTYYRHTGWDEGGNLHSAFEVRIYLKNSDEPWMDELALGYEVERKRLYITHNFPAEEGQYREVPQTGATYTMTISGNTNWSANTVNFGPGVLCTLSQNSGAANESVIVTVTFPETSSTKQGLIELGASPMPEDGYTQDVNYFVFQFRQEGLPQ